MLNVSPDKAGVVRLGLVPNTSAPDPVSSVTAAARFELEGVPRNVRIPVPVVVVEGAAPAPPPITSAFAARTPELASVLAALKYGSPPEVPPVSPVPPLATGNVPVTSLDRLTLLAVKAEVPFPFKTPVRVVAPLPPRFTGSVLIVPPSIGRPVALVRVRALGVPKFGVVRVGDVASTLLPVPVFVTLAMFLLASKANAVLAVKPESVAVLLAVNVVKAPVDALLAPMGVPSIAPPLMSTKSDI